MRQQQLEGHPGLGAAVAACSESLHDGALRTAQPLALAAGLLCRAAWPASQQVPRRSFVEAVAAAQGGNKTNAARAANKPIVASAVAALSPAHRDTLAAAAQALAAPHN